MNATTRHPTPQHAVAVAVDPAAVVARLHAEPDRLAQAATSAARTTLQAVLAEGPFHRQAATRVEAHVPTDGPAALRVTWDRIAADAWPPRTPFAERPTSPWWRRDEEETGWPTATLDVLVTPAADGARLTALMDRASAYDCSTNRVDKQIRDRVAGAAAGAFLAALAGLVAEPKQQ